MAGGSIIVEVNVDDIEGVVRAVRPGEIAAKAGQTFEEAIDLIKPAIMSVISNLQDLDAPGQINVEFGSS
jgi:predicted RNase H-like HicB family nuclease